jgi:hypothetical protein
MAVVQWTESFEGTPAATDDPSEGDDRIRELKNTTRSIVDKEHVIDHDAGSVPAIAAQGWHREGSAVAYYQSAEPSNRPDGATSLDTDDDGRLWIDSDDGTMDFYTGSAFSDLKLPEVDLIRDHLDKSADYTITDTDANTVFVTTSTSTITITLPTVADNTGRIITIKKVDSGSGKITIDGEGAETIDGATTLDVEAQYGVWSGFCDGSEWHTLGRGETVHTTNGDVLKCKIIEIGDWNMDSTRSVNISHGLDRGNIRMLDVIIRADSGVSLWRAPSFNDGTNDTLRVDIFATYIQLTSPSATSYDTASYDSTSYNRGWITIWYVA